MRSKKRRKPLTLFTNTKLLHSKSTYFYKTKWFSAYILPIACSLALLLVMGICINPITSPNNAAYAAYEPVTNTTGVSLLMETNDGLSQETQITAGETAYRYNRFKVNKGTDIEKYQILVQAANGYDSALVGAATGQTVSAVPKTVKGIDMEASWGYSLAEGAITSKEALSDLSYQALPGSGNTNTGATHYTETKEFTLAFAANIVDKPADHYQTNVLLSVAVGAEEVSSLYSIQYMQDMTTSICNNARINDTVQLIDKRANADGTYPKYWIAKLADNNCWMVQNLDLDIPATGLTAALSDMDVDWDSSAKYKPVATQTEDTPNFGTGLNDVQSWDPGIMLCNAVGCNTPTGGDYDAHYTTGNYYSWIAATAGAGNSTVTSGNVNQSICPKGWALPINNGYNGLLTSYGTYQSGSLKYGEQVITNPPLYFILGGYVYDKSWANVGQYGRYWSSSAISSNGTKTYLLYIRADFNIQITPTHSDVYRYYGSSIRCVAR